MRKLPRHLQGEVLMPLSSRITRSQRLELIWLLPVLRLHPGDRSVTERRALGRFRGSLAAGGQTDAFVRSDASLYALGLRFQRKRTRELVASDLDVAAAGEALEQRANGVNLSETFGGGDE
ncbi:hypothetical protein CJR09_22370 [Salmonella enterica subsp. enterica serovar Infantis]|nr:hypothetical protein [Salmonella enterica subsp. enterica serovar Infantis]